jgi:hypothetical protein
MTKAELEKAMQIFWKWFNDDMNPLSKKDIEYFMKNKEISGLITGTCETCIHATEPTESNHYCIPLQIPVHNDFYCADWQGVEK